MWLLVGDQAVPAWPFGQRYRQRSASFVGSMRTVVGAAASVPPSVEGGVGLTRPSLIRPPIKEVLLTGGESERIGGSVRLSATSTVVGPSSGGITPGRPPEVRRTPGSDAGD